MAVVAVALLSLLNRSKAARGLITVILSGALLMTAGVLIFRSTIVQFYRSRFPTLDDRQHRHRDGDRRFRLSGFS